MNQNKNQIQQAFDSFDYLCSHVPSPIHSQGETTGWVNEKVGTSAAYAYAKATKKMNDNNNDYHDGP